MKKLVLAALLGLGVFVVTSLNVKKLSSEQFSQVANDCFKTRNKRTNFWFDFFVVLGILA